MKLIHCSRPDPRSLAHYQRGDHWKSLAVRLLALPHWFNPAAWWVVRRFDNCAEWACDERATHADPNGAIDYVQTLLQLGDPGCRPPLYGSAARGNGLSVRIRRLLRAGPLKDSPARRGLVVAVTLALTAACLVRVDLAAKESATEGTTTDAAAQGNPFKKAGENPFEQHVTAAPAAALARDNADRVAEPVSQVANGAETRETKPAAAPKGLPDALMKIRNAKSDSCHRFLREASLFVAPRCEGQPRNTVANVMEKHGFLVVKSWDHGDPAYYYSFAKKNAFQFPNGHSLDLHILFYAKNDLPARPGKIQAADAALVADINAPYADLVAQERYPKGSILDAVLRSDEVKAVGAAWPLLKKISVSYGYISNRWVEHNPSGFHVIVDFAASLDEKVAGKKMYFYVPSGLDPLRSWDGKEELLDGFTAQDTLGEIIFDGANEWWHGEPDVIEANQKKYLKNRQ